MIPVTLIEESSHLTCPPESFETGCTANDITGSGTFIEVMVYLTDPSVNVSPDNPTVQNIIKG